MQLTVYLKGDNTWRYWWPLEKERELLEHGKRRMEMLLVSNNFVRASPGGSLYLFLIDIGIKILVEKTPSNNLFNLLSKYYHPLFRISR